jgi:flagellar motor switch protein FliG
MDSKTEKKMLKDMKKMKKKELKELCQNLAAEQAAVRKKYKVVEASKNQLEKALFAAIDAKDTETAEIIRSKMGVLKDDLERLASVKRRWLRSASSPAR